MSRLIKYIQSFIQKFDPYVSSNRLSKDKPSSKINNFFDIFLGRPYLWLLNRREKNRFVKNNVIHQAKAWWNFKYLFKYTAKLLIAAAFTYLVMYTTNFIPFDKLPFFKDLQTSIIIKDTINFGDFLGYLVGALTALLAIVFAAISTGFQISANKYSSEISQFVIENDNFRQVLKLFLFSDVFALTTLLAENVFETSSILAISAAYFLSVVSIVYIIGFSTQLFMLYKPRTIFLELGSSIIKNIDIASSTDSRSKSWSLLSLSRDNIKYEMQLLSNFYKSLVKKAEYDDSLDVLHTVNSILIHYSYRSHLLKDDERPWWGMETFKTIEDDDNVYSLIKDNFDIQSEGRFSIPSRDYNWLEKSIVNLLDQIKIDSIKIESDTLFKATCFEYSSLLFSDFKNSESVYKSGDLELSTRIIESFLDIDLSELNESKLEVWFESLFKIILGLIKVEPGKDFENICLNIHQNIQNGKSVKTLLNTQSGIFYRELKQYADRIQTEIKVEGRIITTQQEFLSEINQTIEFQIEEFVNKYIKLIIDKSDYAIARASNLKSNELLMNMIWAQFRLLNNAIFNQDFDRALLINESALKNIIKVGKIPNSIILTSEFPQEIEKGLLSSILEQNKVLFHTFSSGMALINIYGQDNSSQAKQIRNKRMLYFQLMLIFYASEFYQDKSFLLEFIRQQNVVLGGNLFNLLYLVKELDTTDTMWESQHYQRWFNTLSETIQENLNEVSDPSDYGIGISTIYDHPSMYIQNLCSGGDYGRINFLGAYEFDEWIITRKGIQDIIEIIEGNNEL